MHANMNNDIISAVGEGEVRRKNEVFENSKKRLNIPIIIIKSLNLNR